jgi:energy-coupling factor transporter ATP-binding protein EcfA2
MRYDWFTVLLGELCTELTADRDVQWKLEQTARVTHYGLTATVLGMEAELRTRLAAVLDEVEQADLAMRQAAYEALPQGRELDTAWYRYADRLRVYRRWVERRGHDEDPVRPMRWGSRRRRSAAIAEDQGLHGLRLRQRPAALFSFVDDLELSLVTAVGAFFERGYPKRAAEVARGAYEEAREQLEIATESEEALRIEDVQIGELIRADSLRKAREELSRALTLAINTIVDGALEESYERRFSFVGDAWLADALVPSAAEPVSTRAYQRIRYQIENVGSGAIGVAGPRGSGKSTLLSRFARTHRSGHARQWGVCVSAPTRYDPREFLLHLFGQLCVAVLGGDRQVRALEERITATSPTAVVSSGPAVLISFAALAAVACFGVVTGLLTARPIHPAREMTDLMIASCFAACALSAALASWFPLRRWNDSRDEAVPVAAIMLGYVFVACSVWAVTLFTLIHDHHVPNPGYITAGIAGTVLILAFVLVEVWLGQGRRDRQRLGRAIRTPERAAEEWYRRVKFQQSYTTGWSGTVTIGGSAASAQLQAGLSGSRAVTMPAMSTPEVVDAFCAFTDELARHQGADGPRVPVVIGIDEVDKIEDPLEAQAFFNQIKGLFSASSCLFLVSISDDAMAAFERRGMPLRDAFDSSLSTVVPLFQLSRDEARQLIGSRLVGIQEPAADLLFTLSGGQPRELVRLIRYAAEAGTAAREEGLDALPLDSLAVVLTANQATAQQRAVLAAGRSLDKCPGWEELLAWAASPLPTSFTAVSASARDSQAARSYLASLLADAERLAVPCSLHGSAQSGFTASAIGETGGKTTARHADTCLPRQTGALLFWLATVGQAFLQCRTREDFESAETASSDQGRTFAHLAVARQNFPLGPEYVLAASSIARKAWDLA